VKKQKRLPFWQLKLNAGKNTRIMSELRSIEISRNQVRNLVCLIFTMKKSSWMRLPISFMALQLEKKLKAVGNLWLLGDSQVVNKNEDPVNEIGKN
jgi:hypothetical protein